MSAEAHLSGCPDGGSAMADSSAWGKNAGTYALFKDFTLNYGVRALKKVCLSPGEKVLDVGTGPGELALYAASKMLASVHAIDFAPQLIEGLQTRLQEAPTDVTAQVMDGQDLEFHDARFDVTCSNFGVFLFPDYMKGLKEMARVTRPGGRTVVTCWAELARTPARTWANVLEAHFPHALPLPLPAGWQAMDSTEKICATLEAAGFADAVAEEVSFPLEFTDVRQSVEGMMKNPFAIEIMKRVGEGRQGELVDAMVKHMEEHYRGEDGKVGFLCTAVIGVAFKPIS